MQKEKAQSIDFAALNVLKLVHDNQSFSVAADKLSTNQSTISYTIERLRKAFEDPLFVRRHGGVVPTDRCREIVVGANAILDRYRSLIEPTRFEPSEAEAAMTDQPASANVRATPAPIPRVPPVTRACFIQVPPIHW